MQTVRGIRLPSVGGDKWQTWNNRHDPKLFERNQILRVRLLGSLHRHCSVPCWGRHTAGVVRSGGNPVLSGALLLIVIHYQRNLTIPEKRLAGQCDVFFTGELRKMGSMRLRAWRASCVNKKQSHQDQLRLERLRRATSAVPQGVVILDPLDRIEWCNPVAEEQAPASTLPLIPVSISPVSSDAVCSTVRRPTFFLLLVIMQSRQRELTLRFS